MSLFRFELRKLLFNKKTLIIWAILLAFYAAIGFGSSYLLVGSGEAYNTYSALAEPATGPLNQASAAEANQNRDALKERYGDNEEMIYYGTSDDPAMKFQVDYAGFAGNVDAYYNGTPFDSLTAPYGINVLQKNLSQMERDGQTKTFEYRSTKAQLDKETALGEPQFANTIEWGNLFANWGDTLMLFLLFVPLIFIVSPVFSAEASTGMDNLILSSRNGRRKIVTAKLGAAIVTSLAIIGTYLLATFAAGFLAVGSLEGINAAIRSIPAYVRAPFGFTNGAFTLVSALWILLAGTTFTLIVSFISSRLKSQIAVCGVSLAVLFANIGFAALGTTIQSMIQPVIDFGVASFALVGEVFTGFKVYNLFGFPVPYYALLLVFMGVVIAVAALGMYIGQRRRTVA